MLKTKYRETKEQLTTANKHLLESIENFKREIAKKMESAGHETKKFAGKSCDSVEDLIKEHPFKATGIAFGIGALLALLIRR